MSELRRPLLGEGPAVENAICRLWNEEDGQDLVDYALLMVLVGLGVTAALDDLATGIHYSIQRVSRTLAPLFNHRELPSLP